MSISQDTEKNAMMDELDERATINKSVHHQSLLSRFFHQKNQLTE